MVPKMTPPCEVITELWFSKQPFQHHTVQHKTFQWNHRLISTAGDSIWFCIIYWLQNSILFSEQHFSHRRGLRTHFVNFNKYCRGCTNIHWPVLCRCYIWTCPWKQDTTDILWVTKKFWQSTLLFPLSVSNSQKDNKPIQFTLPIKASWSSNNNPVFLKEI